MAYTLSSPTEGGLYCAFNSSHKAQVVELPHWPGTQWQLLMDSGRVSTKPHSVFPKCLEACGVM